MKTSNPLAVAVAGAAAFFIAWSAMGVATGEEWRDVLPLALAGAVVFGLVNFVLRLLLARRRR